MRRRCQLLCAFALLLAASTAAQTEVSRYSPRVSNLSQNSLDQMFGGGFGTVSASTTFLGAYSFDSGGGCVQQGWTSVDVTAGAGDFGDFAGLFTGLTVGLPYQCGPNFTCAWGFFNGSTSTFACGGYPTQAAVPAGSAAAGYLYNEIWSPLMPVVGSSPDFELSFDVFRDLDLADLVFYTWRVRSFVSGVPGPWRDRENLYYGPGRDWVRLSASFGDLVDPGATQLQIALGAVDMCGTWCGILGDGACHGPSPVFDNVRVYRVSSHGPQWFVHPVDLFQDNFAGDGTTTGTVRVDIARDINPRTDPSIRPGDSLVVRVDEPTVGLDADALGGPAVYLHVKDVAPGKSGAAISGDPARWPLVEDANGWTVLRLDTCRVDGQAVPGRYCVDLDDDLYVPGDTVEFYMSARAADGWVTYWTEFTGATTDRQEVETSPCEMTCLPAAARNSALPILYVDDCDGSGAEPFFDSTLQMLGIYDEVDRYDVRGASYLAGNGPGSRVRDAAAQLAGVYREIIWNCGNLSHGLVGDGSGRPEKSPDARLLADYLTTGGYYRGLYLSGDDVAAELATLDGDGAAELRSLIQYELVDDSHRHQGNWVNPYVIGVFGTFASHVTGLDTLIAYGGCSIYNRFDVLAPLGNAVEVMRYNGGTAGRDGAVIAQQTDEALVVLSGFSFHYITQYAAGGAGSVPVRAHHLHDILLWLSNPPPPVPCPPSRLDLEVLDRAVRTTWSVGTPCYDLAAIRLLRHSDLDTVRVPVGIDTTLVTSGAFVDHGVDVGAWNTYELYGVRYSAPPVRIKQTSVYVPAPLALYQNSPNPFAPSTTIRFTIPGPRRVTIEVYDVAGRRVATVLDEFLDRAGENRVEWDGTDGRGARVASGVYFCRMTVPGVSRFRKMVVLR